MSSDTAKQLVERTEVWPDDVQRPENVTMHEYAEADLEDSHLDVSWFSRKNTTKLRPAMIFVHGGSWRFGDKKQFYRQSAHLAERYNIFCVNIEYRLQHEAKYPAALEDCKCAIRWTRSVAKDFNIDPNRIGIGGGSAGAHLSAMVATTNGVEKFEGTGPYQEFSSDVQLAVLFNGQFDMVGQLKDHFENDDMYHFFGGYPWEIPEIYGDASPFLRIHHQCPPMLFLHGDSDYYSHHQSMDMAKRLKHYGVHAEVEIYEGKEHGWFNQEPDRQITTNRMATFIAEQFKL